MANVAYGHSGTAPVNHGGGALGSYESSGGWSRRGRGQRQATRLGGTGGGGGPTGAAAVSTHRDGARVCGRGRERGERR